MNKKIFVSLFFLFLLFLPANLFCYSTTDFGAIDKQLEQDVKKLYIPAMAVIVVNPNEVLFCKTYGKGADIDTPFIIGSMSKSFTALAIMQLVEQGKIHLEDTLCTYIDCTPYLKKPEDGFKITIRQLLNQTSNLDTYQKLGNAKPNFNNDEKFRYANINYNLLGKIIESISGKSYAEYIEENILQPLQMDKTAATLQKSKNNGLIKGHQNYFGIAIPQEPDYPTKKSWSQVPAGYISSSIVDMGKYLQMYLNGGEGIISSESIDKMFYETVPEYKSGKNVYGMGWGTTYEMFREPLINHSGLVENFTSNMFIFPQSKIGVAVLVNMNDYLVTNNLLSNIVNPILGGTKAKQSDFTYILLHLLLDVIYLAVLFASVLPIIFIKKWKNKLGSYNTKTFVLDILIHLLLPILLLCFSLLFGVPLWVVFYFVKDLFFVLVASAVFLFGCGAYKVMMRKKAKNKSPSF